MKRIYDIYKQLEDSKVMLIYEGEFTQEIIKSVLALAEKNFNTTGEQVSTSKKVFNVMVECLQNIVKHSTDLKFKLDEKHHAIFMISQKEEGYIVSSGNYIDKSIVATLKEKLDQINNLDKEGLKILYRDIMKNQTISDKGGAGLGFIDMARKSGEKLNYAFKDVNDKYSFFSLQTQIKRA